MRRSGILMHITSLPGAYGVGTMGRNAFAFVDFLRDAGQSYWQILPLTPTGYGDSPYQSCSTFAGNHYLIDLDKLKEQGLIWDEDLWGIDWGWSDEKVDFGKQYENRLNVLRKAYGRFGGNGDFDWFCQENSWWLADFALFMALKGKFGGAPWYQWESALKFRNEIAMNCARSELADEIRFYSFVQYIFYKQWNELRNYAHNNGVSIIGDVPIYVPYDSVEVWSNPQMFQLDGNLDPIDVAGCPPDAFSADGQLWGNPLYRWDVMAKDGYAWWLRRLGAAGKLYDVIRIDHFRGFEAYWSVPFEHTTARGGRWIKGPGMDFINAVKNGLPHLDFIAEDLGFLTPEVYQLLADSGLPGMKVLEFAFDVREPGNYLPHTYPRNCVCYVGTHDNETVRQWKESATPESVTYARRYLNLSHEEGFHWGMIRGGMSSVADLFVAQIQDYLGLGSEARINTPGTASGNWQWRMLPGEASPALARKIYEYTQMYERLPHTSGKQ